MHPALKPGTTRSGTGACPRRCTSNISSAIPGWAGWARCARRRCVRRSRASGCSCVRPMGGIRPSSSARSTPASVRRGAATRCRPRRAPANAGRCRPQPPGRQSNGSREATRRASTPPEATRIGHEAGRIIARRNIAGRFTAGSARGARSTCGTTNGSKPRRTSTGRTCVAAVPTRRHGAHLKGTRYPGAARPPSPGTPGTRASVPLPVGRALGTASSPHLGIAAIRRRNPGRNQTHPPPHRPSETTDRARHRRACRSTGDGTSPSWPQYPDHRVCDPPSQHPAGPGRPCRGTLVPAYRAEPDPTARQAPHRKPKNPFIINHLILVPLGEFRLDPQFRGATDSPIGSAAKTCAPPRLKPIAGRTWRPRPEPHRLHCLGGMRDESRAVERERPTPPEPPAGAGWSETPSDGRRRFIPMHERMKWGLFELGCAPANAIE